MLQTISIELINSQKNKQQKEPLRSVISSIRVGVVNKTDDEVHFSSTV